jgi:O-antigen/teichoic acid export membrane protein
MSPAGQINDPAAEVQVSKTSPDRGTSVSGEGASVRRGWKSLTSTRLAQGTFVGIYGQFIQLAVQLVSVPVMSTHWGLEGYGVWLILFTVPSMLAMADLGLTTAGANSMIAAIARGETVLAARIYSASRWATFATGGLIVGLIALFVTVIHPGALDFAQTATHGRAIETAAMLLVYGLLAVQNGISLAAFRAADAFASSGMLFQTIILAEAACAIAVAFAGGGLEDVALAYMLTRAAGTVMLTLSLRRTAPWLRDADWGLHMPELRKLFAPATAALVLPVAYAVTLQGAVMAIGAIGGPAAVPAFTTVRTLSRTTLQFAFRLNTASMPRYTVVAAHQDRPRMAQLVLINLLVPAGLLIPAAIGMLIFGLPFIRIWTGGIVHPSFGLLALMVGGMLLNGAWVPISNLIMAVNRHGSFTYFFLAASLACVGLGAALAQTSGALGMAWALLLLEILMVVWVWRLALQLDIVERHALTAAWHEIRGGLRHLRPSRSKNIRKETEE